MDDIRYDYEGKPITIAPKVPAKSDLRYNYQGNPIGQPQTNEPPPIAKPPDIMNMPRSYDGTPIPNTSEPNRQQDIKEAADFKENHPIAHYAAHFFDDALPIPGGISIPNSIVDSVGSNVTKGMTEAVTNLFKNLKSSGIGMDALGAISPRGRYAVKIGSKVADLFREVPEEPFKFEVNPKILRKGKYGGPTKD